MYLRDVVSLNVLPTDGHSSELAWRVAGGRIRRPVSAFLLLHQPEFVPKSVRVLLPKATLSFNSALSARSCFLQPDPPQPHSFAIMFSKANAA